MPPSVFREYLKNGILHVFFKGHFFPQDVTLKKSTVDGQMFNVGTVNASVVVTVPASLSDVRGETCSFILMDGLLSPVHSTLLSRNSSLGLLVCSIRGTLSAQEMCQRLSPTWHECRDMIHFCHVS